MSCGLTTTLTTRWVVCANLQGDVLGGGVTFLQALVAGDSWRHHGAESVTRGWFDTQNGCGRLSWMSRLAMGARASRIAETRDRNRGLMDMAINQPL